ncbi:MAG TPA: HDOD domain-containing protein [Bryobacteraceae bacterium]|nr:HDOD domain-containing protein [Bryobacteraceae bacterium]
MKLPWRKDPAKKLSLTKAAQLINVAEVPDSRGEDQARGSAILAKHGVERSELGDLAKLPPFRPVIVKLMKLFDGEDVSAAEVTRLVESDAALTADLLAVVNSALYSLRAPVTSPLQAVNILGFGTVKSLAAAIGMRGMAQGAARTPVVRRFWLHSLATATIAQNLCPLFHLNTHEVYVDALLHDLGRLGLLAAHPQEYSALALAAYENAADVLEAEQSKLGMTHCKAGSLLCRAWFLSESVRRVAERHHDRNCTDDVVAFVQFCCRLANGLDYPTVLRRDREKPEDTIAQFAPKELWETLDGRTKEVRDAIDAAIKAFDF